MGFLRSWGPHDRGGFFLLLRLIHGDDERFLPVLVVIVEVGGGYSPPRDDLLVKLPHMRLHLRRGRRHRGMSPLLCFPPGLFI